jgi:hypothetical protein
MKAIACGKNKIAKNTAKTAQEMHRISTDAKILPVKIKRAGVSGAADGIIQDAYFLPPERRNS